MKIALIAMSGVRAYNEQLTRLGMTLPGFVEWFRWIPVPSRLAHPFSPGRWALIAIHVFLINFGLAVVGIAAFASTGRR